MRGLKCDAGDGENTDRRCTVTDASHQDDRDFLRYPINVIFDQDLYAVVEMFEAHDKRKCSDDGGEWPGIIGEYLFVAPPSTAPKVKTNSGIKISNATELIFMLQKCPVPVLAEPMPIARLWSVKNGMSNPSDNECCDDGQNHRTDQDRPT